MRLVIPEGVAGLELGCPLDDQLASRPGWVGIVPHPYGERTRKLGVTAVPASLRVTVRWSTRSPGVGLGWLFAIWSGTPLPV
jgi:hypothetical protein